uniref:Uncharacterized protein n=1 Tax=Anguilla anguilla TaxID=7936 RepID=A0A0E9TVD4_ANGAN
MWIRAGLCSCGC